MQWLDHSQSGDSWANRCGNGYGLMIGGASFRIEVRCIKVGALGGDVISRLAA